MNGTIASVLHSQEYKPVFFDLNLDSDYRKFIELTQQHPDIKVYDQIRSQVGELIKSRNANIIYKSDMLEKSIDDFFAGRDTDTYGLWCYYSWSCCIVHLLPETEFVEVRTNRNKNKITTEEQVLLSQKKVGIIGLSVGQSVASTLALERICGELRIADFDILELSNYNRIRTSLRNMGLNKTISVAREIAEIDPYLHVTCYTEGINANNLESFLTEGGKLDVLIDESDGLEIKIIAREKAKELGIPVLMEASERGIIDVERFDLDPDRPILHGLLEGMDLEAAKRAQTNEEKMPFMMQIVGLESLSDRMKSSMLEISQSLTTWPQLASAVTYGGGMTADVCRRMLLGNYHKSGRYIVDISDLVNDETESLKYEQDLALIEEPKSDREFGNLIANQQEVSSKKLSKETITAIVEAACLAPSGGNSQPWKWIYKNNLLYLFHEIDISTQWLDYMHRGAYISFGAALENLKLEAFAQDLEVKMEIVPDEDSLLVATISFQDISEDYRKEHQAWFDAYYHMMKKRVSNRYLGNERPVPNEVVIQLENVADEIAGARLQIINDRDGLVTMSKVVGVSEKLLLTHETAHKEFYHEIKWSEREAELTRVGIDIRTVELSATEMAGFNLARNWSVVKNLVRWGGGGAFEKLGTKMVKSSSALALLTMPHYSRADFIEGGKALQRVWMKANEAGLSIQPMSAAIFLWARLVHGKGEGLTDKMIHELTEIRKVHQKLFEVNDTEGEVFLFRIFYADEPKVLSLRKHLYNVFEYYA